MCALREPLGDIARIKMYTLLLLLFIIIIIIIIMIVIINFIII